MTVPDFHLGDKAKAAIGTTRIKGLNSLTIPGIERNTVDVVEFGQDFDFTVPTSAKWTEGSIAGNYVRGDTTGQKALRTKLFANEGLDDLRLYENEEDFWAPDLANNSNSVVYIKGIPAMEVAKSGVVPYSATLLVQGLIALFDAHITGGTLAFTTSTITDSGDGLVDAGFAEGQTVIIDGSTSNDAVSCLITAVADGVLTISVMSGTMAAETALTTTVVHGGSL